MVDGELHLLVLPFIHVVHFLTKTHVLAGLHVVVQKLVLVLSIVFENLLLLTFIQIFGNLVLWNVEILVEVLESTHVGLLVKPLGLIENLFILEPSLCFVGVKHLIHLINLSRNIVLFLELLVHDLVCIGINLVITNIHVNHLVNALHVN
jgi:hypothetical protein